MQSRKVETASGTHPQKEKSLGYLAGKRPHPRRGERDPGSYPRWITIHSCLPNGAARIANKAAGTRSLVAFHRLLLDLTTTYKADDEEEEAL